MANPSGQGPAGRPKRLGAAYSVVLGVLGALTSILALVQLLTTKNVLIITLLLAIALGLAVITVHYTWHSRDPRLRWLGLLTVAVLVLAGLGGGYYGLGRTTTPHPEPTAAPQHTSASTGESEAARTTTPQ